MSVLSCSRRGCQNVMCDRLSHEYGYICDECWGELVSSGPATDIEEFMEGEKPKDRVEEAIARYSAAFPLQ